MSTVTQPQRLVSLAAGVVQEFSPDAVIYAAAKSGFNAAGIWCELDKWDDELTKKVKNALTQTGIVALDIEVVWFKPGEALNTHDRFVDIAKAVGARNILCVSSETDIEETKKKFQHLCEVAEGTGINVVLEFLAITEINTLDKALEVVRDVGHPCGGLLIDTLHLQRTGSSVADLALLANNNPELLPYLQLCDASEQIADTSFEGILEDALYLRKLLGEGELPLREVLQCIDAQLPISLEIRARELIEGYPNLQDRTDAVFISTQRFLNAQVTHN